MSRDIFNYINEVIPLDFTSKLGIPIGSDDDIVCSLKKARDLRDRRDQSRSLMK
jgi:hypothetical protein